MVIDLRGRLHGVGAPLLHAGAVDVLAGVVEGQPGDGLVLRDGRSLDELERAGLIVEGDGKDGPGRSPGGMSGRPTTTSLNGENLICSAAEHMCPNGRYGFYLAHRKGIMPDFICVHTVYCSTKCVLRYTYHVPIIKWCFIVAGGLFHRRSISVCNLGARHDTT